MARFPAGAAEYVVLLVNAPASSTDDTVGVRTAGEAESLLFIRGKWYIRGPSYQWDK